MRRVYPDETWSDSWKYSYQYDLQEVYGVIGNRGYSYAYSNRQRHTLELVQSVAPPGAKVLDIAAAQGNYSLMLAELGYDVTWNDLRSELADYVKLKYEFGIMNYAPGNILGLNFQEQFDVVLITEIVEHVAHSDIFLKEVAKFIKPKGYIVMTTPNGEYFRNTLPKFSECQDPSKYEHIQFRPDADGHIFLLHVDEVKALAEQAGLIIREIRLLTNPLTNGHLKTEFLLKIIPKRLVNTLETSTQLMPQFVQKKISVQMAALFEKKL